MVTTILWKRLHLTTTIVREDAMTKEVKGVIDDDHKTRAKEIQHEVIDTKKSLHYYKIGL